MSFFVDRTRKLLTTAAVLAVVLHLVLSWKREPGINTLIINGLIWSTLGWWLWNKRATLRLGGGDVSTLIGSAILMVISLKSLSLFPMEMSFYLRVFPLLMGVSLALVASGWRNIAQYGRGGAIACLFLIPEVSLAEPLDELFNVSLAAAKLATLLLWYLGFDVMRQGVIIYLPDGAIEVYTGCSGLNVMLLLLRLAVILLLGFSLPRSRQWLPIAAAIVIALVVSSVRVAVMAVVVSDAVAFEYWHGPQGGEMFSTAAILLFGLFCQSLFSSKVKPQQSA
jgi:cyanoexosortase A